MGGGKALLIGALASLTCMSSAEAQSPYWLLPSKKLSFTGGNSTLPVVTNVSASQSPDPDYVSSNAWFNPDGSVRFFISPDYAANLDMHIKKPDGTTTYTISLVTDNRPEIHIIPRPGYCGQFYLVYSNYDHPNHHRIQYNILNTTDPNNFTLTSTSTIHSYNSSALNNITLASSKPKSNGESYLYAVNDVIGLYKFDITSTGISQGSSQLLPNHTSPSSGTINFVTTELEVAFNGGALTWGTQIAGSASVYRVPLIANTGNLDSNNPILRRDIQASVATGVEFMRTNSEYVFATVGSTTGTSGFDGLVRLHFAANAPNPVVSIPNTSQYANSQIETAYNNTVLVASSTNILVLDASISNTLGTLAIALPVGSNGVRYLPNFIDGFAYEMIGEISGETQIFLASSTNSYQATYSLPLSSGYSSSWSISPSASILSASHSSVTINFTSAGTYTLTLTATPDIGSCLPTYTRTRRITVHAPAPTPPGGGGSRMADIDAKVVIFPNPATGSFAIADTEGSKLHSVRITDISGREVKSYPNPQPGVQLPVNGIASGVYVVHIQHDNGISIRQLVITQ